MNPWWKTFIQGFILNYVLEIQIYAILLTQQRLWVVYKRKWAASLTWGTSSNHIINNTKTNNHWVMKARMSFSINSGAKVMFFKQSAIFDCVNFDELRDFGDEMRD